MAKNIFTKLKEGFHELSNNPSFTLKETFGYASGCFGNTMGQDMVGTFTVLFLTKYVGIEAALITILMVIAKVITIVADPVIGGILDHGIGKQRKSMTKPFLLLTPIPLSITSVLLFVIPGKSMTFRIIWVFAFYLIFCISDALYDMTLLTMSVRMTKNPKDRKNFYTLAEFAGSLGTTLPGGVIPIFVSLVNEPSAESGIYFGGALLFGVLGFAAMMVPYFTLNEKNRSISIKKPKVQLNFKALFTNRPMWLLIISQILDSVRQICYGSLAFFYSETLDAFWLSTVVGSCSVVLSYLGIALVPIIGKKLSSRNIICFSYLYSGLCYMILLICGYKHLWLVGLLIAISGFPNGMMSSARKILLADSTEYMEWKTWKKYGTPIRNEGMVFALFSMAGKIKGLWSDLLLPAALVVIGYVSAQSIGGVTINIVQSNDTLNKIFYLVTLPGMIGNFLAGSVMFFDNYTGKKKEQILKELDELHAQQEAELKAQEMQTVETVTATEEA